MKRLLLILCVVGAFAQAPSQKVWPALSAVGATSGYAVAGNDVHTIQAIVTGSPASCTVNLDGSVDAAHWYNLSGDQTCTSNAMFHVVSRGVLHVRGNVTALSGGATITLTYVGHSTGGQK